MKYVVILWCLLLISLSSYCQNSQLNSGKNTLIDIVNQKITLSQQNNALLFKLSTPLTGNANVDINHTKTPLSFNNGIASATLNDHGLHFVEAGNTIKLYHYDAETQRIKHIPLWLSLIPPILAIVLALIFKEVIISLFTGIFSGLFIINGLQFGSLSSWTKSLMQVLDTNIVNAIADTDHISVIVFSMLIGGMVAIISKNGGMHGIVENLGRFAQTKKSAQQTTWLLGVLIFFDDYANTLIVGNTMRSVTDKFRVSREKLAYIVDSTAAPIAAIAFITTWIGAELGYIGDSIGDIPLMAGKTPYALFFASLKYSFYPILTLAFILMLINQGKDYGPMLKAERRAHTTGQVSPAATSAEDEPNMEDLSPVPGAKHIWWHAAVPIFTVIGVTILGLLVTGFESGAETYQTDGSWGSTWAKIDGSNNFAKLGALIGMSNSYVALIWSSLCGVIVAIVITIASRTMSTIDVMHWMVTGFKTMLPAIIVLILAWSLASVTESLHTSEFLSDKFSDSVNPYVLPAIIFVMAAFIAFSTGSSWSTMAILYPIAIPTTYAVCVSMGISDSTTYELLLCVISTVLAASVLGDHCSPISDTTILSSLASDCNHLDHVKTQLPYALTVGGVSITGITVSILFGGGWLVSMLILGVCLVVLYLIVKYLGQSVQTA